MRLEESDLRVQVLSHGSGRPLLVCGVSLMAAALYQVAIPHLGLFLGEMRDLDDLAVACAADQTYDFFLSAAPLPITGAVGSAANPLAIRDRRDHDGQPV